MFSINKKFSFLKKVSVDFIYTVSAVIILNIVQQILVQPYINRVKGAEYLGDMLYYLGLTYLFSQKFGAVLGHQRILYKHNTAATDGDFLALLGVYAVLLFLIGGIDAWFKTHDLLFTLAIALFMVICLIRYYAQVEFRVNLWFKGYLIYFLILSAGYLLGLGLFQVWEHWLVIFVVGEVAAILFVVFRGSVLRMQKPGPMFRKLFWPTTVLIISYLLSATSYLDRVLIQPILGSVAVSEYYAISLVGKIMNMLMQPLITLMVSYLADRKTSNVNLSGFKKIILYGIPLCAVLVVLCSIATPIAVQILYPNLTDAVPELNIPINIGSVIGFAAGLLTAFLMAEATVVYQIIIRGLCFVVYIGSTLYLTTTRGLLGYAYAAIIANSFCLVCAIACGVYFYKKKARMSVKRTEA